MNVFFEALNKLRDGFDSKVTSTVSISAEVEALSISKSMESSNSMGDSSNMEKVDIDEDMLGVTVCILPPKKSSAS